MLIFLHSTYTNSFKKYIFQETAEANVLFSFIKESAQSGGLHDKVMQQSKDSVNCKHGSKHFDFTEPCSVAS